METQVKFAVVGHYSREPQARALAYQIGPTAHVMIDPDNHGAAWNHRRALEWAAEQDCRVVIIEDDAIPVPRFVSLIAGWLERFPDALMWLTKPDTKLTSITEVFSDEKENVYS